MAVGVGFFGAVGAGVGVAWGVGVGTGVGATIGVGVADRLIWLNWECLIGTNGLYLHFGRTVIVGSVDRSCGDTGSKFPLHGIRQKRLRIDQAKRHHSRRGAGLSYVIDVQHKRAVAGIFDPTIHAFSIAVRSTFTPFFPYPEIGVLFEQLLATDGGVRELKPLLQFNLQLVEFCLSGIRVKAVNFEVDAARFGHQLLEIFESKAA